MNTKSLLTRIGVPVLSLGLLGGLGATLATSASAATTPHVRGEIVQVTHISHRYDGGGAGNWAVDKFNRTLTIDYLGKSSDPAHAAAPYEYTAQVDDAGTFVNLPGQLTPNQGGHNAGRIMKPNQVTGTMTGHGQFSVFYASAKDARGLTPRSLNSFALNASPAYASSQWPALAFPAGTTITGLNEAAYAYDYTVPAKTVVTYTYKWVNGHKVPVKHVRVLKMQDWKDTAFNGDGQLQRDGNIQGR
jgi:hypothetical protein